MLITAASLSLFLIPLAIKFANRRQVMDQPGGYKLQEKPVPYLGGVAIVVSFAAVVVIAALVRPPVSGFFELTTMLGLACALCLVGLVDDVRGLNPFLRLFLQILAAAGLLLTGVGVQLLDSGGPIDATITVMWVAGITNAFNLLDNMDGLSAGIATIAAGSFFVIALVNGQFLVASLAIALVGCALGFLRHNRYPARIYMGDAGSLFLGFVLAYLGLKLRFDAPRQITAFVPLVILALPILDTMLVTVGRLRHGRNPLAGGRDHLSHRLVFVGLSVPRAVRYLYVIAITLGWAGLIISRLDVVTAYLALGLVGFGLMTFGVVMYRVPVYSNSLGFKIQLQRMERNEEDYAHEALRPKVPAARTHEQ